MAIKSEALVDFMAEWTETQQSSPVTQEHWSMYFDGSFTLNGAEGGVVLIHHKGDRLLYVIQLHFRATNNVAEYEALVNGLRIMPNSGFSDLTSVETLSVF
jgi:ribonuclease HI